MENPVWAKPSPGIETVEINSADDFISLLRRSNPTWWEGDSMPWAFRGHANSEWKLLPSAWRSENVLMKACLSESERRFDAVKPPQQLLWRRGNYITGNAEFGPDDEQLQRELAISTVAELIPFNDFNRLCDQRGLVTPLDTAAVDPAEEPLWVFEVGHPLVADEFLRYANYTSALALAQHHGIPTRLLDWTLHPLIASFFAVERHSDDEHESGIAVWAVHRQKIRKVFVPGVVFPHDVDGASSINPSIRLIRPTVRDNPFIAAQSGVFTTYNAPGIYFMMNNGTRPALEDFVTESGIEDIVLRKAILSSECVRALSDILTREGISRSSLMPTLDNVARDVWKAWAR